MNRIRELRQARKWRQTDLAAMLNTAQQTIARYESGDRGLDVETIYKLCELFSVSADYLLGLSELPGNDFSAEEQALVRRWRALDAQGREYLLHTLALVELGHAQKNNAVSQLETAE